MKKLEDYVRGIVTELIDAVAPAGTCDAVDALARELHAPPTLDEPQDRADGGGLADAVAPEQRRDAGRRHLEGDVFDDLLAGDRGRQSLDDEDGGAHTASPR